MMMSNKAPVLRTFFLRSQASTFRPGFNQIRCIHMGESEPGMMGSYVNPPRVKRSQRDPYGDWWDKQDRRNYGEPVHEDNDILGVFSTEDYNHATPGKAWLSLGTFVAATLGLCAVVYQLYPDRPSAPRTWSDGLEVELGGPNALLANKEETETS